MTASRASVAVCFTLLVACAGEKQRAPGALEPASGSSTSALRAGQNAAAKPSHEDRLYDPATVQTVRGTIAEVEYAPSMRSETLGFHVILEAGSERLVVHLAPSWFIEEQSVEFEPGNAMEVTGSRLTLTGRPVILAREVSVAGKSLTLRDEAGTPVWVRASEADVR